NPLFQVTFQLVKAPVAAPAADHLLSVVDVELSTAKFDLRCDLWEAGGRVEGHLEYSTDLFRPGTIRAMARHFEPLVEAAAAAPGTGSDELPLLTATEEQRLLRDFNQTAAEWPALGCVHEAFERCAAEYGTRLAISDPRTAMTYDELNRRSNQLARHLRARGV